MSVRIPSKGRSMRVKYPLHGNRNILKWYSGTVMDKGRGPSGRFVTIQDDTDGQIRSLSVRKMVEPHPA